MKPRAAPSAPRTPWSASSWTLLAGGGRGVLRRLREPPPCTLSFDPAGTAQPVEQAAAASGRQLSGRPSRLGAVVAREAAPRRVRSFSSVPPGVWLRSDEMLSLSRACRLTSPGRPDGFEVRRVSR